MNAGNMEANVLKTFDYFFYCYFCYFNLFFICIHENFTLKKQQLLSVVNEKIY